MALVSVICLHPEARAQAEDVARVLGVELNSADGADYGLIFDDSKVVLRPLLPQRGGDVWVDFCGGEVAYRRLHGGGAGQAVAKAVGVSGGFRPHVLDATAGLGEDAFVLASLGCSVTMIERSPVAHVLLQDGLRRAKCHAQETDDVALAAIVDRMRLQWEDSIAYMRSGSALLADVVYLDPMFPPRKKSAAVKKNMAMFHNVIGVDSDEDELLDAALRVARFRVVVKRPRIAPCLGGREPTIKHQGKSSRFDIYALRRLPGRP